ncbi:MAG: EI24 domain-containing protein [Myxococcota bacterium]
MFQGFGYLLRGARFVYFTHPSLVRFWIAPIVISTLAIGLGAYAGWHYSDAIVDMVWETPTGDGFFAGLLRGVHSVLEVLVSMIVWVTSIVVVLALSSIVAAPFNDALSEAVEAIESGKAESVRFSLQQVLKDTGRTVKLELTKQIVLFGVMAPLFCCSFTIPGVGQLMYSAAGFGFTALYLAMDYIDWPAARRNKRSGYRWRFVRRYFGASFGFGTGVFLALFVPVLNLFFMPAAVAGGTLLFLNIEDAGDVGDE